MRDEPGVSDDSGSRREAAGGRRGSRESVRAGRRRPRGRRGTSPPPRPRRSWRCCGSCREAVSSTRSRRPPGRPRRSARRRSRRRHRRRPATEPPRRGSDSRRSPSSPPCGRTRGSEASGLPSLQLLGRVVAVGAFHPPPAVVLASRARRGLVVDLLAVAPGRRRR